MSNKTEKNHPEKPENHNKGSSWFSPTITWSVVDKGVRLLFFQEEFRREKILIIFKGSSSVFYIKI